MTLGTYISQSIFLSAHVLSSYSQLILFILTNLECTREDCETLVSTLKTLIKQLEFENEVSRDLK